MFPFWEQEFNSLITRKKNSRFINVTKMTVSKTNLNESIDVSYSWDEIRNKRHKTIFQLYVLSGISVVIKQITINFLLLQILRNYS